MREESGSSSEFDSITYVAEVTLKYETTICLGLLSSSDSIEADSLGFQIVSADGLGIWAEILPKILNAISISAKHDYLSYTRAFTQKFSPQSKPGQRAYEAAQSVWAELEESEYTFSRNRLGLLQFLVALRNRTRGHGATTQSQYEAINAQLLLVVSFILESSPILSEDILKPIKAKGENYACRILRGYPTQEQILIPSSQIPRSDRLYYRASAGLTVLPDLITYLREDDSCFLLNGKRRSNTDKSEFLDYVTNTKRYEVVTAYQAAPSPRPESITAGRSKFDWNDTIVNNLPIVDFLTYVPRARLEAELREYLLGSAVNFVSLKGQGGAGKTTLALRVARQIVNSDEHAENFEVIVWFSARDVDLDERAGPLLRRRQVTSLASCAALFFDLLSELEDTSPQKRNEEGFAEILASGRYKFLLIFDNFESFDDVSVLQQFIKRNLAHPSKALMTSREDAFHGDVPIDIGGLSRLEASDLMRKTARHAGCEPRLSEAVMGRIYDATLGNPYAIKLVVNEFARSENLDEVLPRAFSEDYLSALFRRSFERLDDGPAYLFLLLGRSPLARDERFAQLCSVGAQVDYQNARRAILDNNLLDAPDVFTDRIVFRVSWAAQAFCSRIIIGHRMEREVELDAKFLNSILSAKLAGASPSVIHDYLKTSLGASKDARAREREYRIIKWLREHDADSARGYALEIMRDNTADPLNVRSSFKLAVELKSADVGLWLAWAEYEANLGETHRALDLILRAVDFTEEQDDVSRAGRLMLSIMREQNFKETTSFPRRDVYTNVLISRLERNRADLTPKSLSVLGWLHLQTGGKREALKAVNDGLSISREDPDCTYLRDHLNRPFDRRGK